MLICFSFNITFLTVQICFIHETKKKYLQDVADKGMTKGFRGRRRQGRDGGGWLRATKLKK